MDISATVKKDSFESTTHKGSSLLTGGNLIIKSGSTAKIEGSNAAAQGDILIDAQNVEITAAKNMEKTHSTSYTEHLNYTASYATNNSWGISGDTSHTWSNSESETRVNAHLSANNITIKSTADTAVRGGVVAANNSLDLDVGGNLVVESLQDKSSSSSYSYGVNGGYSETRDKDNNKTGSGNGGANFSVSMSERKWVTEQTSLTGSHVNIYVEKKTALTGAVIASTSNDLTLDTGSFEYSDIKDKDISWNGGLTGSYGKSYVTKTDGDNNDGDKSNSAKYNTWSASLTYGYSERRQTNFATIGEGTIIVRDGNGSLASLKRDVSKSQYGTVDMGFQGGLTVDSSTVAMVKTLVTKSPDRIYEDVKAELVQGYEDAAKTTEEIYEKSVVMYEKTTNYIGKKGFHTNGEVILIELQYKEAFAYFIPGTDEVQNGIRIIRGAGADGEIIGITDYAYDGTQRSSYRFGDLEEITHYTQENYIIVDGQRVKSHELIYSDDVRLVNTYDSTGNSIYRSANYQYSDGTYVLKYVDDWMVGATGEVIKDIKQIDKIYAGIIMNDNRLAPGLFGDTSDRYNTNNYVGNSGCLLASAAIVDDFYGGAYGDPKKMDALADQKGLYYDKYKANVKLISLATSLGYVPKTDDTKNIVTYKLEVENNIAANVPTFAYYSNNPNDSHFAIIGGKRYNGDGSTDYLIRDTGSSKSERSILNGDTLSNSRGQVKRIDWMIKREGE